MNQKISLAISQMVMAEEILKYNGLTHVYLMWYLMKISKLFNILFLDFPLISISSDILLK